MSFFSVNYVPPPSLVENGMKYFINATLKQCHQLREKYENLFFNISCSLAFFIFLSLFLLYKYKGKLTPMEKQQKEREKQQYILSKIKIFKESRQRMHQELITNLPMWENDYEKL